MSSTSSPSRYEPIARSSTKCSTSSDRTRNSLTDQVRADRYLAASRRYSMNGALGERGRPIGGGSGKDLLKPGDGQDRASGGPGGDTFRARDGFREIL